MFVGAVAAENVVVQNHFERRDISSSRISGWQCLQESDGFVEDGTASKSNGWRSDTAGGRANSNFPPGGDAPGLRDRPDAMSGGASKSGTKVEIADRCPAKGGFACILVIARRGCFVHAGVDANDEAERGTTAECLADATVAMASGIDTSANVDDVTGYSIDTKLETVFFFGPDTSS